MNVFICICASSRPVLLNKTLDSLKKINKPKKISLSVIIIDNTIHKLNRATTNKYEHNTKFKIFYEHELNQGIVHARNKFLKILRDKKEKIDLVGFIDDDCIVDKEWLVNHMYSLKISSSDISTGPQYHDFTLKNEKKIFYELTNRHINKDLSPTDWAATNNVLLNYKTITKSNILFDIFLNSIGGSDQLFFLTLRKGGSKIIWNKNAFVIEDNSLKKINSDWFFKRNFRYGFSGAYMSKTIYGKNVGLLISLLKIFYFMFNIVFLTFFLFNKKNYYKIKMNSFKIFGILNFFLGKKILHYH